MNRLACLILAVVVASCASQTAIVGPVKIHGGAVFARSSLGEMEVTTPDGTRITIRKQLLNSERAANIVGAMYGGKLLKETVLGTGAQTADTTKHLSNNAVAKESIKATKEVDLQNIKAGTEALKITTP